MSDVPPPRVGNKIPDEWDNPFDVLLLRLTGSCLPLFHATGHTPNMLTTYSFASGLGAVWALWRGNVVAFALLYLLSYAFDCADGQMARRYHMESPMGDVYDHVTDVVVLVLLLVVIHRRYHVHWMDLVLFLVVLGLAMMHLGCQQDALGRTEVRESLDLQRPLCPHTGAILWTRFFGTGTLVLFTIGYVCYLQIAGLQRDPTDPCSTETWQR